MRLASWAGDEGAYHNPTIDFRKLREHSEGVIATSSCVQGLLPQIAIGKSAPFGELSRMERNRKLHAVTETYLDIFGDDFYLEAHNHGIEDEKTMTRMARYLSEKYDIPIISANDCHYARAEDFDAQKVRVALSTSDSGDPTYVEDVKYAHENLHVKGPEEMVDLFPEGGQMAENTLEVAEKCGARLPMEQGEYFFPEFPGLGKGETPHERLVKECARRFEQRYPNHTQRHRDRIRRELGVIKEMGFSDYFLIVADLVQAAKAKGIPVGPGRGSAAGSMVTYVLGITGLDPMKHGLLFDRFLNPERVTMPDIDIDFDDERRDEVLKYLYEKYGEDRVAKTIAFNTLKTKGAIRDIGKVFRMEPSEVDHAARQIPSDKRTERPETILEEVDDLREMAQEDPRLQKTIEYAKKLYGMERHTTLHAAAAVITPGPLSDYLPTERKDGEIITQFDGDELEDIGLLKMDVLGLKTLREIRLAREMAEKRGATVTDEELESRDDPAVYENVFAQGDTRGIFQFKSGGMQRYLEEMKPSSFEHITAMNALYRPGPMKLIPDFIERMHGEQEVTYLDESVHEEVKPEVKDILEETYGIMVYQEQIMQVCRRLAGFSLGEADIMRRAVGKKKRKLLEKQRDKFIQGCKDEGHSEALGETVFELIEEFADYGFNKCLTGDTTIKGTNKTIEELYETDPIGEPQDMSAWSVVPDERVVDNEILMIKPEGRQPVYEVSVKLNSPRANAPRTVTATANHKFPTRFGGEKTVAKLTEDDALFILKERNATITSAPGSRPNVKDDIRVAQVQDITFVGTEEVYDVTMAREPNNFVLGNGIVSMNSHAAAYSALAYQQAYLKTHHPTAFFAAAIRTAPFQTRGNGEEKSDLIQDARDHGVDVLPPSVNESGEEFMPVGEKKIRFGLSTLKSVGKEARSVIEERRANGPYDSFVGLCCRAIPNKSAVRSMIQAGAMDGFDLSRKAMYEQMDEALSYARKRRDYQAGDRKSMPDPPELTDSEEWPDKMRFRQERDVAGIYTSGRPTDKYRWLFEGIHGREHTSRGTIYTAVAGSILAVTEMMSKNDNPYWWVRFMDADGTVRSWAMFSNRRRHIESNLEKDRPSLIIGSADTRGEYAGSFSVENVIPLRRLPQEVAALVGVEPETPEKAHKALQVAREMPDGDTELWINPPEGRPVALDQKVRPSLPALREFRKTGAIQLS
nr:DNA polymerase III subunit alpha [Salinibacter sp.]